MTSAVISTNRPTLRAVALRCVTAPVPNDCDSAVGDSASCANRCRACEQAATRARASTSPATGLPSQSRHQGTQSDPAKLCLADPSPMVCAAAGMASCGIVCVDGNGRLDWAGVYCGIANKGGTSPQWIRSRDGMDGALKLANKLDDGRGCSMRWRERGLVYLVEHKTGERIGKKSAAKRGSETANGRNQGSSSYTRTASQPTL